MAAMFMAVGMNAQTVLFEDDFESYTAAPNVGAGTEIPAGYTSFDVNGNGYNWGLSNPADWTQSMGAIYDGNFMVSASYITGLNIAVQADNILVLPLIDIPNGASDVNLTFYAGSGTDPNFFSETYDVIVSSANDQASILAGDVIFSETLPAQGGATKGPINLDAYIGQQIYISFHHRDTFDEFVLGIDNILVEAGTLSLNDSNINGFNYFYSPQTKNLTLTANTAFSNITIFNVLGQEVIAQKLASTNEVVTLSSLKNGVYIANVVANGQTTTFKIVKR